ncbi:MAG: leucine-rich repeat domain-containing protein [Bacteroidia bacterium]|nr:leucine-rich repeat domain-containing protein [Bacteroidia bacterium]
MKKTFLILAALLCSCFALKAQIFDCDGLTYRVLYDFIPAVKLEKCTPHFQAHDFVIPSTINHAGRTYIVMEIGEGAFEDCMLTGSLTIGNNVISIDKYAFAYCGALDGTLIIGESVDQIGEGAFEHTGFTQIIFRCSSPPHLISYPFPHSFLWYDLVVPCDSLSDYVNAYGGARYMGGFCSIRTYGDISQPGFRLGKNRPTRHLPEQRTSHR